ncbi:acyl carrier protein [Brevibacillus fulvus]|nr:acyl carrier protein [Brevibacillus fulvus]
MMENREGIKQSLLELIGDLIEQPLGEEAVDEPFAALGVDSLMSLQVAVHLEREFGVHFSEEEIAAVSKLSDLLALIDAKNE